MLNVILNRGSSKANQDIADVQTSHDSWKKPLSTKPQSFWKDCQIWGTFLGCLRREILTKILLH